MVAAFGLLQAVQVRVELLRRRPRRAVDPLELLALLVPAPVRAGDAEQLVRPDAAAARQMRAQTEVGPAVVPVDAHPIAERALLGVELFDDLPLERLFGEPLERLVPAQLLPHERLVELDDLGHAFLDPREVLGRQRLRQREVVVEAVLDRRADRVLRAGDDVAHGLGHHVRRRVAQHMQPVRLTRQHRRHAGVLLRDERQVHQLVVHPGGDGLGVVERSADRLPLGEVGRGTVGELELRHEAPMISAPPRGEPRRRGNSRASPQVARDPARGGTPDPGATRRNQPAWLPSGAQPACALRSARGWTLVIRTHRYQGGRHTCEGRSGWPRLRRSS